MAYTVGLASVNRQMRSHQVSVTKGYITPGAVGSSHESHCGYEARDASLARSLGHSLDRTIPPHVRDLEREHGRNKLVLTWSATLNTAMQKKKNESWQRALPSSSSSFMFCVLTFLLVSPYHILSSHFQYSPFVAFFSAFLCGLVLFRLLFLPLSSFPLRFPPFLWVYLDLFVR